jgi:N-acetylglucosamine-6-phosphate deacetylase
MIVLCASRLYTPHEEIRNALVFVEDGFISELSSRDERDLPKNASVIDLTRDLADSVVVPGFLDIHIHGGAGVDAMRASVADLQRLNMFLAVHGVTGYFPTTVAAPLDETCAAQAKLLMPCRSVFTWRARF